jgi:hypothetical protein
VPAICKPTPVKAATNMIDHHGFDLRVLDSSSTDSCISSSFFLSSDFGLSTESSTSSAAWPFAVCEFSDVTAHLRVIRRRRRMGRQYYTRFSAGRKYEALADAGELTARPRGAAHACRRPVREWQPDRSRCANRNGPATTAGLFPSPCRNLTHDNVLCHTRDFS